MIAACRAQGLPDPDFSETDGGFRVVFSKDPYTPDRLRAMGLTDRQTRAIQRMREAGSLSNEDYQTLTGVSKRTATRDLDDLEPIPVGQQLGRR